MTLTVYLNSESDFEDARYFSILAAKNIYGIFGDEAVSTQNAWYAVGVGDIDDPLYLLPIFHNKNSGTHYYATLNIVATNIITDDANVTYRGRNSVILGNNFRVDEGAVFTAVTGCP